jgi:hypothetical protein
MSRQRCVNRTKADGRTNVIYPTRALFGSWTVEKQYLLNILDREPIGKEKDVEGRGRSDVCYEAKRLA